MSLAAWLWLLLGQGFFWRTDVRLPARARRPRRLAVGLRRRARARRGRRAAARACRRCSRRTTRAGRRSSSSTTAARDGTGELARELARRHGGLPLTVASPGEPPAGWTGKLWAVRHGIALARAREPEYLLLTDADIAHEPDSLRELVAAARSGGFDMVSQMARLRVESLWERLVVPAFVYFFAQLYPFRWIDRRGSRTAAAAGGCVLLRTRRGRAGAGPGLDPAGRDRRRGAGAGRAGQRRPDLAGPRRPGGQRAARTRGCATCGGWSRAARTRSCGTTRSLLFGTVAGPRADVPGAAGRPVAGLARRVAPGRAAAGWRGLGRDDGDVPADAALLPAAAVARSAAAVHRVAVPADDRRLGGAALPGARRGLEGPHLRASATPSPTSG